MLPHTGQLQFAVGAPQPRPRLPDVHNKATQAAYHAQFRTADEYRDHWLRFEPLVDAGVGLVPDIPDGLTLDEVQDRLNAWRESVQRTKAEARRPPRRDPPGL